MQVDNKLLDDLARVASSAVGALSGIRTEVESQFRQQFERILSQMDVVSREEFEATRAMAAEARARQEDLEERLKAAGAAAAAPTGAQTTAADAEERITRLEALVATLTARMELLHPEAPPRRPQHRAPEASPTSPAGTKSDQG